MVKLNWRPSFLIEGAFGGFITGLLLAKWNWQVSWYLMVVSILVCVALFKRRFSLFLVLGLTCLQFGILRGQAVLQAFEPLLLLKDQKAVILGKVVDDPAVTGNYQTEFHLEDISILKEDGPQPVAGRVKIKGFTNTTISRGDVVKAEGKLRSALGNRQAQISYAKIELTAENKTWLELIRARFLAATYSLLPEPHASLGLGLVVGLKSSLPDNLIDQLRLTGLTHIVVVSGYNLTILILFARRLLARYSKYWATAFSLALVMSFILITGFSPSIVRAAVVSILTILAWHCGRTIKPVMVILLAAAITAGIQPNYLWADLGWHLSFLAFIGILVLAPLIKKRFIKKPRPLSLLIVETLAAQLLVLPLILFTFGQLSWISLLANSLVLPLIPFAMLATFITGLTGLLLPISTYWLVLPARVILGLIIKAIEGLASWQGSLVEISLSKSQMVLAYLLILVIIALLYYKTKRLKQGDLL